MTAEQMHSPGDRAGDFFRYAADMPAVRALADSIPAGGGLVCFGERMPLPGTVQPVEDEIRKITEDGHQVSMIMINLPAKSGLAFRPGVQMCTQSTVKAIYIGAMLTFFPRSFAEHRRLIRDTIVLSSNEAYERLRDLYGPEPVRAWCRETGVDEGFADLPYPRAYTARDMLKLWTRLYCFLNDGSDRHGVGRFFAESVLSAARERLGNRCPVHSKAGWENGLGDDGADYDPARIPARFTDGNPLNDECATNDTGVVYAAHGPYLFVIYSDFPCPWPGANRLYGLTEALYTVRFE